MPREVGEATRELLVAGHINLDRFLKVRTFPADDRTEPAQGHRVALGGTAATIARCAAGYGVASGLLARVGADFPAEFRSSLDRAGIDLRGVESVPKLPTPNCTIIEDGRGRQRTIIDQGAMGDGVPGRYALGPWLDEYAWIHLTTGPPRSVLAARSRARARGLRVAVDPAQEIGYRWSDRGLADLLNGADLLWGNRDEISTLVRRLGHSEPADLTERVPLVIRTEGSRGATAFSRDGEVHVRGERPRRIVSAVGAGDAFRGGFYAAWFAGTPLAACLEAGSRSAARWMEGAA